MSEVHKNDCSRLWIVPSKNFIHLSYNNSYIIIISQHVIFLLSESSVPCDHENDSGHVSWWFEALEGDEDDDGDKDVVADVQLVMDDAEMDGFDTFIFFNSFTYSTWTGLWSAKRSRASSILNHFRLRPVVHSTWWSEHWSTWLWINDAYLCSSSHPIPPVLLLQPKQILTSCVYVPCSVCFHPTVIFVAITVGLGILTSNWPKDRV